MLSKRVTCIAALLAASVAWAARRPGEPLKPGWNLFSKQQDVELGQVNAKQVVQQYPVAQNQFLQDYARRIGQRLAEAPEAKQSGFPFSFTVLNMPEINAFALPGGPMFIFTGLMKAADTEGQLAGVMAHEMAHVILRHGTNQASKANALQLPLMLLGGLIGNETTLGQLANMGLGLGANSYLMKFSRDAETEADALGSYLIAHAGYNPVEMATFFQKLGGGGGSQGSQFFSDHPNPGNREKAIRDEVQVMPRRDYGFQTGDFQRMKSQLGSLPAAPRTGTATRSQQPQRPAAPSGGMQQFRAQSFSVSYPANWQAYGAEDSSSVTFAPREGLVNQGGNTQVGYGAILSYFMPNHRSDLRTATDDLVQSLRVSNPRLQVSGRSRNARVGGANGLITTLTGESPYGGAETDALVTVMRPEGLFYMVFVAPENGFQQLQATFQQMVDSLRFQ